MCCGTVIDLLIANTALIGTLFSQQATIDELESKNINFKNSVSSYKGSEYTAGDLAISMGKNPKNSSDNDLNFIIQSFKTKCDNNKEIWHKNFYTEKNKAHTDFNVTGLLNLTFGLETFGDIYGGCEKESLNVSGTGLDLYDYNSAVVCYNDLYYLFQGNYSSTLIVTTATLNGKSLNFEQILEVPSKGLVHDAIIYNDNIYVATSTGVYRYNASEKTFTTITSSYHPFTLSVIDGMLNISTPNQLALYDGNSIITKNIITAGFSKFTDGIYTASDVSVTISGGLYPPDVHVYFYDKNYDLIGVKEITGKPVGSETISLASTVYSSNGMLLTVAQVSNKYSLVVSYDGGDTWIKKISLFTLGVKFFAYKNVIVVKEEGCYAYSVDGGNSWKEVDYGRSSSYRCGNAFLVKGTFYNDIIIPINGETTGRLTIDRIRNINLSKNGIIDYNYSENIGYIVYFNGLKIQWLKYQDGFLVNTVKDNLYLPLPLTSPSTCVIIGYYDNSSGVMACAAVGARLYGNNTNRFKAITDGGQYSFFAIGY